MSGGFLELLTLKSVDWAAPSRGGLPSLTRQDVMAALAGDLSSSAVNLAMYLFLNDLDSGKEVYKAVSSAIVAAGGPQDPQLLEGLTRSVMGEAFDRSPCQSCKGSGQVIRKVPQNKSDTHEGGVSKLVRRELITCSRCKGHGVSQWTAYRQAKEAGVNERSYSRLYLAARSAGHRSVRAWMGELTSHLTQRLQD